MTKEYVVNEEFLLFKFIILVKSSNSTGVQWKIGMIRCACSKWTRHLFFFFS